MLISDLVTITAQTLSTLNQMALSGMCKVVIIIAMLLLMAFQI